MPYAISLTFVLNIVHSLDLLLDDVQKTGPVGVVVVGGGAEPIVPEHTDASRNVCVVFWRR